ncbi:uncharacterized protein METZ01_LOCUS92761 [marine metagenome]|uniref:Uncharacterized protein n=1 Tax=marine metagenome TaxID=408172 RepID=A0A381VJR6_9ZZZZ
MLLVRIKNSSIPPNFVTVRIDEAATLKRTFLFSNTLLKVVDCIFGLNLRRVLLFALLTLLPNCTFFPDKSHTFAIMNV